MRFIIVLLIASFLNAGFFSDAKERFLPSKPQQNKQKATSNLSNNTIISGLKEALEVGVKKSVSTLGAKNGFLKSKVKIPLPKELQKASSVLDKLGQKKLSQDLIKKMNEGASLAASKTAKIFYASIKKMSIKDGLEILQGKENAATNYFRKTSQKDLEKQIKPIVKKSLKENKTAYYYEKFNKKYKEKTKKIPYLKNYQAPNLDDYVTNKAIDGLFIYIEKEEKQIRKDPIKRTTDLLKKVFQTKG